MEDFTPVTNGVISSRRLCLYVRFYASNYILDKPQLKVCLMLVIGMITDLTPLPLSLEEEDHQVVVLDTSVPLSDKQMAFLENHCNLLQGNGRSDENTYLSCLRILCSLIHRMYV